MATVTDDPLYLKVSDSLERVCNRIYENAHKQSQEREANKKKSELQSQMAAQLHARDELRTRLNAEIARASSAARLAADLRVRLTITETDQSRLSAARDAFAIAKELTGVRWDFTAPQHLAKGFMKSTHNKLLEPFEVRCELAEHELWTKASHVHGDRQWRHIAQAAVQQDKENAQHNN